VHDRKASWCRPLPLRGPWFRRIVGQSGTDRAEVMWKFDPDRLAALRERAGFCDDQRWMSIPVLPTVCSCCVVSEGPQARAHKRGGVTGRKRENGTGYSLFTFIS